MPEISKRLKTIASLVPDGARVCDIGTDHGYLAIYLKQSGRVRSVIATDIREKPLQSARRNIVNAKVTGIETRLCDGLSAIKPGEADTIVIAGMGGDVIAGILFDCQWIKQNPDITLIIQAMTSTEIVRRFLLQNGFEIVFEPALSENGKLYSVILSKYTGEMKNPPEYYYYIGEVNTLTDDGLLYIKKQQKRCADCAAALKDIPEKQDEYIMFKNAADGILKKESESL